MKATVVFPVGTDYAELVAAGVQSPEPLIQGASEAIERLAKTANRHMVGRPTLLDSRATAFNIVELTFVAETADDEVP